MTNNYARGQHDTRPWGTWEVIDCGEGFCVKRITVNAGGILSLQLHHYRAEHWIIVAGTATIILGERQLEKKQSESVYIPVETKHRIQNNTDAPLIFIEVQTGENLDENDIVRFEDKYGRAK
ncbi:MAG: phosphomannose isomerase type II C-terminal cupin domain [Alphaproteobacteria bacterium]|nr:phosphomannose isomerase type II C-terminal cupin domain [Alphaproteobacteria bacterium]